MAWVIRTFNTSSKRCNVSSVFGEIASCEIKSDNFIKTLVHLTDVFSQCIVSETGIFWNIFRKKNVANSVYRKIAIYTLWACNFTKINPIIGVVLRTFQTFAINYFSKYHHLRSVSCEANRKGWTPPFFVLNVTKFETFARKNSEKQLYTYFSRLVKNT